MARFCLACGDPVLPIVRALHGPLTPSQQRVFERYCEQCAMELLFGLVSPERAKLDSVGRGCPLEPCDDDPGPWQQVAERRLEEGGNE
jgi:hypothetical protein